MRVIRGLTVAALVLLNAGLADAQASRGFKDSWFWGAKAGVQLYQVVDNNVAKSPIALMGGADWLITRSSGGLYVSFDYSFFSADSIFVNDSTSPLDAGTPRVVQIGGLRRFTIAGLLFPLQTYRMHPYLGFGFTLSHVTRADPQGICSGCSPGVMYRSAVQEQIVLGTIETFRSSATPLVMLGTQLKLPFVSSAFGQITATPANNNFFLFSGSGWRTTFEGGLRINVGSSLDRAR
ncbi:MAG: hypothetical protein AABZ80_03130 [Gemmatimonadota bacterium]